MRKILSILVICTIFFGCAAPTIKKEILVYSNPKKKPAWVEGNLKENQYRGVATRKQREKDAISDAFQDAVRKITQEIGIKIEAKFEIKKVEHNNLLDISVRSETRSKSKAAIRNVKEVGTYIEKYKGEDSSYYYNAWVLVEIPKGEKKRARIEMKRYCNKMIDEAGKLLEEAENKENDNPYDALLAYRSIKRMMLDAENFAITGDLAAEVKNLKIRAEEKIEELERIRNPMVELEQMEGEYRIRDVELTDMYGSPLGKRWSLDIGEYIRVKICLDKPSYIYIIGYDKKTEEPRLLFPNKMERENFGRGEKVYPDITAFYAQPPPGANTIFIIASEEKLDIPRFGGKSHLSFTQKQLWDFIKRLRKTRFDIKKVEMYIREPY